MEFVKEYPATLSLEECNLLIDYFEKNTSIPIEVVRNELVIKKNRELNISIQEDSKELDLIVFKCIQKILNQYSNELELLQGFEFKDTGYIIQRYNNNGLEKTERHIDSTDAKLTIIIFLNTVQLGGEIEFNGRKIKPEVGKVVIFPTTWMLPYADNLSISNPRYNVMTNIRF
jgi:hypothetical protein